MAENIFSIVSEYPRKKVIIVAHNDHIGKEGTVKDTLNSMGDFLSKKLGNNYCAYGFLSFEGNATGFTTNGKAYTYQLATAYPGTYEYYLNREKAPIFFIDIRDRNTKYDFLTGMKGRSVGFGGTASGQFKSFSLQPAFDGVFFIRKTTHTSSFYF